MLFLKAFNVGNNFDSKLRQFHIFTPLCEKHFWSFADFRLAISISDLLLRQLYHVISRPRDSCIMSVYPTSGQFNTFHIIFNRNFISFEIHALTESFSHYHLSI